MTREEKQLLLIDLCAREPYHPRIQVFNQGYEGFQDGEFDTNLWLDHIDAFRFDRIEILPYLRPMSSMTDEEWRKMHNCCNAILMGDKRICIEKSKFGSFSELQDAYTTIDWLLAHHFDYRGLIEKGLALPAPEGMYDDKND